MEFTKRQKKDSSIMKDVIITQDIQKQDVKCGDVIMFINNETYSHHTFVVCYSNHATKFYLQPYNFDDKPISFIQRYMDCAGRMQYNEFLKVGVSNLFDTVATD